MKIYSLKKLMSALLYVLIAIAAIIAQLMKGFHFELTGLTVLILFFAYSDFRKSFSKETVKTERDERNQLVSQRSNATSFKIVMNFTIGLQILFVIFYGIYKNPILLPVILAGGRLRVLF